MFVRKIFFNSLKSSQTCLISRQTDTRQNNSSRIKFTTNFQRILPIFVGKVFRFYFIIEFSLLSFYMNFRQYTEIFSHHIIVMILLYLKFKMFLIHYNIYLYYELNTILGSCMYAYCSIKVFG